MDLQYVISKFIHSNFTANIENARAFTRYFFQARVMRPVSHCDPSTTILGFKSSIPVFVSGAALAKLGHPDGEYVFSLNFRNIHCASARGIKHH